ncbi:MAG: phage tail protein [Chloroflexi bacterium]|nr:phage tail protein [Chloroflexota bacterium]
MSEPFLAEIKMFGGNFAPRGYAFCNGQIMSISQNTAVFSLLGTNYGGDGRSTFGLPDLQGRAPMFWGQGPGLSDHFIGESDGYGAVTLIQTEIPAHSHVVNATNGGSLLADDNNPTNAYLAPSVEAPIYAPTGGPTSVMHPLALGIAGGNQPHNNLQPYLAVTFIIALAGIFPPRG